MDILRRQYQTIKHLGNVNLFLRCVLTSQVTLVETIQSYNGGIHAFTWVANSNTVAKKIFISSHIYYYDCHFPEGCSLNSHTLQALSKLLSKFMHIARPASDSDYHGGKSWMHIGMSTGFLTQISSPESINRFALTLMSRSPAVCASCASARGLHNFATCMYSISHHHISHLPSHPQKIITRS